MEKVEKKSNSLKIDINEITKLVGETARNSYGVLNIATKKEMNLVSKITKKGKMEDGIIVNKRVDNTFDVSVYLVLAQGIKITEALRECQKSIRFVLKKKYPNMCRTVDVYVCELRQ